MHAPRRSVGNWGVLRVVCAAAMAVGIGCAGCSSGGSGSSAAPAGNDNGPNPSGSASSAAAANPPTDRGGTVRLLYVEWDSCTAATELAKLTLEKAGYKVSMQSVAAALMFEGLANNGGDVTVCAWLPTVHGAYYAKIKDQVYDLGPASTDDTVGLAVPDYVTVTSIEDLAKPATAAKFGDRIVGIDPGAAIMQQTQSAITAYKLPMKLISGSDATMAAVLGDEIRQHKWVVVTSWSPHWMWSRWKLKYLQDPKGVYGEPQHIDVLVRKGFRTEMPGAYAILARFKRPNAVINGIMDAGSQPGGSLEKAARAWAEDHADVVDQWIGAKP